MRRTAAQLVLIIGLFTMLATSAAEDHTRRGELLLEDLEQGDSMHFSVRISEVARRQGELFEVQVAVYADDPGAAIHVEPDDARIAPQDIWTWQGDAAIPSETDAGSGEITWDTAYINVELSQCPSTGECVVGFSVEVAELLGESLAVEVTAEVRRRSATKLCASSRDFDPGASVEVERDD